MSSKARLVAHLRLQLNAQLERLATAARDAHAAATDPDAKAESKYDTRSLEASYLASGQARQLEEMAEAIRHLETFNPPDFDLDAPIDSGALVEVSSDEGAEYFLLAPACGGFTVVHEGREITLLTPSSRLYQTLLGQKVGSSVAGTGQLVTEIE